MLPDITKSPVIDAEAAIKAPPKVADPDVVIEGAVIVALVPVTITFEA